MDIFAAAAIKCTELLDTYQSLAFECRLILEYGIKSNNN